MSLSVKALIRKEWKQGRTLLALITLLFVFLYPLRTIVVLKDWRERLGEEYFYPEYEVPAALLPNLTAVLILILLIMLAVIFIGVERNTRRHDFAFALPFKRSTMFVVKWLIGVGGVTLVMFIMYSLSYVLVSTSEFHGYVEGTYLSYIVKPWLSYVVMYTLTLFIGTITGEMVSQLALTFIFTVFPIGFIVLLNGFFSLHAVSLTNYLNILELDELVWPLYLFDITSFSVWPPIIASVLFLIGGTWLYEHNPSEHNGEFLLFKSLEPVFRIGIIVCFALLGGIILSALVPYTLSIGMKILFYWIGVAIFAFISYILTKRLFTMNITVKGK